MRRAELIEKLAMAMAEEEGWLVTPEQARARGIKYPTRAQRQCNPGNIRRWRKDGVQYPTAGGYVDFFAWAGGNRVKAVNEGWRLLRVLIGQYIDGQYTGGKSPTLAGMIAVYAPAADSNVPERYARNVAARAGIAVDVPLGGLIA